MREPCVLVHDIHGTPCEPAWCVEHLAPELEVTEQVLRGRLTRTHVPSELADNSNSTRTDHCKAQARVYVPESVIVMFDLEERKR